MASNSSHAEHYVLEIQRLSENLKREVDSRSVVHERIEQFRSALAHTQTLLASSRDESVILSREKQQLERQINQYREHVYRLESENQNFRAHETVSTQSIVSLKDMHASNEAELNRYRKQLTESQDKLFNAIAEIQTLKQKYDAPSRGESGFQSTFIGIRTGVPVSATTVSSETDKEAIFAQLDAGTAGQEAAITEQFKLEQSRVFRINRLTSEKIDLQERLSEVSLKHTQATAELVIQKKIASELVDQSLTFKEAQSSMLATLNRFEHERMQSQAQQEALRLKLSAAERVIKSMEEELHQAGHRTAAIKLKASDGFVELAIQTREAIQKSSSLEQDLEDALKEVALFTEKYNCATEEASRLTGQLSAATQLNVKTNELLQSALIASGDFQLQLSQTQSLVTSKNLEIEKYQDEASKLKRSLQDYVGEISSMASLADGQNTLKSQNEVLLRVWREEELRNQKLADEVHMARESVREAAVQVESMKQLLGDHELGHASTLKKLVATQELLESTNEKLKVSESNLYKETQHRNLLIETVHDLKLSMVTASQQRDQAVDRYKLKWKQAKELEQSADLAAQLGKEIGPVRAQRDSLEEELISTNDALKNAQVENAKLMKERDDACAAEKDHRQTRIETNSQLRLVETRTLQLEEEVDRVRRLRLLAEEQLDSFQIRHRNLQSKYSSLQKDFAAAQAAATSSELKSKESRTTSTSSVVLQSKLKQAELASNFTSSVASKSKQENDPQVQLVRQLRALAQKQNDEIQRLNTGLDIERGARKEAVERMEKMATQMDTAARSQTASRSQTDSILVRCQKMELDLEQKQKDNIELRARLTAAERREVSLATHLARKNGTDSADTFASHKAFRKKDNDAQLALAYVDPTQRPRTAGLRRLPMMSPLGNSPSAMPESYVYDMGSGN
jgi:chromosome segregation ATPase